MSGHRAIGTGGTCGCSVIGKPDRIWQIAIEPPHRVYGRRGGVSVQAEALSRVIGLLTNDPVAAIDADIPACGAIDMRKGFKGLAAIVRQVLA